MATSEQILFLELSKAWDLGPGARRKPLEKLRNKASRLHFKRLEMSALHMLMGEYSAAGNKILFRAAASAAKRLELQVMPGILRRNRNQKAKHVARPRK